MFSTNPRKNENQIREIWYDLLDSSLRGQRQTSMVCSFIFQSYELKNYKYGTYRKMRNVQNYFQFYFKRWFRWLSKKNLNCKLIKQIENSRRWSEKNIKEFIGWKVNSCLAYILYNCDFYKRFLLSKHFELRVLRTLFRDLTR